MTITLAMRQVPLALGSAAPQHFDNFMPGGNAQWPQLREALGSPQAGVPVFMWGPQGSGKSHLLHAAAHHALALGVHPAAFDVHSVLPWQLQHDTRLLVLDDCEQFDATQQHAAFTLFVEAVTRAVPVLAAGRLPPVDLPLREDLRTRLGWGLVYHLQPPADTEVRAVLRREAERRGILLGDDVVDHLLTRHARDLSHLMHLLERLDHYALSAQRAVTVPLLRLMLAESPDGTA
jgi:DnaA family protein